MNSFGYFLHWSLRRHLRKHAILYLYICVLAGVCLSIQPQLQNVVYKSPGEQWQQSQMPLHIPGAPTGTYEAIVTMHIPKIHANVYQVLTDDCLVSFFVNDVPVDAHEEFCDFLHGRAYNLAPYIHSGANTVRIVFRNQGWDAGMRIKVAKTDPLYLGCILIITALLSMVLMSFINANTRDRSQMEKYEWWLLSCFILLRAWLFWSQKGISAGWDAGNHLEILHNWHWEEAIWTMRTFFYSYHPPFVFILTKVIMLFGPNDLVSAQIFSAIFSLISFYFLREFTKYFKQLHTWNGIAFVYITASIPHQIFMTRSVNMDIAIFACCCACLYYCARIFWPLTQQTQRQAFWYVIGAIISIVIAFLSKSSALLLLSLPFIAGGIRWIRTKTVTSACINGGIATAICVISVLVIFPYYHARYQVQVGKYLVSNMDLKEFDKKWLEEERVHIRDKDIIAFWKDMFIGEGPSAIQDRDLGRVRLANTWKDIWAGDRLQEKKSVSLYLSVIYEMIALLLLPIGIALLVYQFFIQKKQWGEVGALLFGMFLIQLLALILYAYKYPHPFGRPTKIIYGSPILIFVGYLLTLPFYCVPKKSYILQMIPLTLIALFMFCNHYFVVY